MTRRIALLAALSLLASGAAAVTSSAPASAASYMEIKNMYGSNRCLSAANNAGGTPFQNGDAVLIWGCSNFTLQEWKFVPEGGNSFEVVNEVAGKCLDAENDSGGSPTENGDPVRLWTCNGNENQVWLVTPIVGGCEFGNFYAGAHGSPTVLDAVADGVDNPDENGDETQMWLQKETVNQLWSCPT